MFFKSDAMERYHKRYGTSHTFIFSGKFVGMMKASYSRFLQARVLAEMMAGGKVGGMNQPPGGFHRTRTRRSI
jgi:hypothetical protein